METYWVSCKKRNGNENSSVIKTKQKKLMLLSNFCVCGQKKSTFITDQELSNCNNIWND